MKTILFTIAVVAASLGAHAEYLYWQVKSEDLAPDFTSANGARVFASTDGGVTRNYLNIGYADYDDGFQSIGYAVQVPVNDTSLLADCSAYANNTAYAFYIELINYDDTYRDSGTPGVITQTPAYNASGTDFRGQSAEGLSYTQLAEHGFAGTDLSPINMAVWNGGSYSPVPEPTSAMLVLFGLAGLALRRRAV